MIRLGIEAYKVKTKTISGTGGNTYTLSPEQRMRNAYYAMRWTEQMNASGATQTQKESA